jgi:hypothetical protein
MRASWWSVLFLASCLWVFPSPTCFLHAGLRNVADASNLARFDSLAELPRTRLDSSMAMTPSPGSTLAVRSSDELQHALDRVRCGDKIFLEARTIFVGHFTLPAKNCDDNHWIIIRTSAPDSLLPPEGTRLSPCYRGVASLPGRPPFNCSSTQNVMATLMAVKSGGPITTAPGANHYRLGPGLEITRPVGTGINYGLIMPGGYFAADHIIIDRDWLHGTAQDETTRGLYLSGVTYAAVIDSYFTDFHCTAAIGACVDSQAIAGGLGNLPQGTWKINNNFLEAGAENILFGGGVGTTIPTDIEIRHNYLFKPLTWMPKQPGFVGGESGHPFIVKNLFELKNAQRVLVEGNVMENNWPGFTQHGAAILLTPLSEGGNSGNPNATVADITLRYNRISHAASGMAIAQVAYQWGPPKQEARLSIHDDIFDDLGPAYYNGDTLVGVAFELLSCPSCTPLQDITIDHVTMLLEDPKLFMLVGAPEGTPIRNLTFTNNIISVPAGLAVNGTGPKAPCGFKGATNLARLNNCIAPYKFDANALIGGSGAWPGRNLFPRDPKEMKFLNHNGGKGGDYRLSPTSPHKHAGTDGKDPGADVELVEKATAGVV